MVSKTCVYSKQGFTLSEVVLIEEFLVTTINTFGQEKKLLFTINEIYLKRGCGEAESTVFYKMMICHIQ